MNLTRRLILALALISGITPAVAQQFPTVPGHSIIGRLGVSGDSGPSQAIPFTTFLANSGFVKLPVIAGDVACFEGITGKIKDCTSTLPSFLTIGNLNTTGTFALNVNPNPSSLSRGLSITQTPTGSSGGAPVYLNFNNIINDSADVGGSFLTGYFWQHSFGGSTAKGGRETFTVALSNTGPTAASNTNRFYTSLTGVVEAAFGDGGTGTGPGQAQGAFLATNFFASAVSGATNLLELSGGEVNIAALAGSSMRYKAGWSIVTGSGDAVRGAAYDCALCISNNQAIVGWKDGILLGDMNGHFPIGSDGNVLRTIGGTFTNGINFTNSTISGSAFASPGFFVDGTTGFVNIGAAGVSGGQLIMYGGPGITTIAAPGSALSPILILPTASGTLVSTATSPLVNTAGVVSCPTCATSSSGGAISGTSPIAVSAGGAVSINDTAVTPNPYGSATQSGTFTVDQKGRLTAAANVTITPAVGSITGLGTGTATALGVNIGTAGSVVANGGALGTPSSGTATNLTGTASGLTAGNVTTNANLTGDVTSVGNVTTLTNAAVIAKVLTGYTSGAGTVSAADTILSAVQKLNGNDALKLPLAGGTMSGNIAMGGNAITGGGAITGTTITGTTFSGLPTGTSGVKGIVQCDGTTITCSSGTITAIGAASTSVAIGTTTIASGATNTILYQNGASPSGTIGEIATANSSILVTNGSGVPSLSTTLPAFTLGGTVSGGGRPIDNVVIGNSTPLAGSFTSVSASSGYVSSVTPASNYTLDNSSSAAIAITGSGSVLNADFSPAAGGIFGLVQVSEFGALGTAGLYFLDGGGNAVMVSQTGAGSFVAPTTTPAAGHASIAWNGTKYKLYSNITGAAQFRVAVIKN
jgi:hypothetical protein